MDGGKVFTVGMVIFWVLTALFALYSLVITLRGNFTAGTLLLWGITACLLVYTIFQKQIQEFCKAGFGRVCKWAFFAGLLVFAALFVFVAVSGYGNRTKGDERAIIVLGAGLDGDGVSDTLRRRLDTALTTWQGNPGAYLVVTGGQGAQEILPEAVAMQRWLAARGVPEDKIIIEDKSTSTEENLRFARELLEEAGVAADEPVAVVSNAFHCYRAGVYAKREGFSQARTVSASMNLLFLFPSYMREVLAILALWFFK